MFYKILTYHASILAALDDGSVVNVSRDLRNESLRSLVAFIPHPTSSCCYLLSDIVGDTELRIIPQTSVGPIVPLRLLKSAEPDIVHFYSPETGAFLCAAPIDPQSQSGPLALAPEKPREFENFTLEPVAEETLPKAMRAQAHELMSLNEPDPSAILLSRMITAGPSLDARDALNAAAFLLPRPEFERFAKLLMGDIQATTAALRALFPEDIYAQDALPALLVWLSCRDRKYSSGGIPEAKSLSPETTHRTSFFQKLFGRPPATAPAEITASPIRDESSYDAKPVQSIGTHLDRLDEDVLVSNYVSLPFAINMRLRRLAEPRRRACVIASARNEGLYILEWVAYHRAIGFDHIFIYSNDNEDGSDDLLRALAEAGQITWIDNTVGSGRRAQWKAYAHALRIMPDALDFEWSLLIDLDEFFVPNPIFGSVGRFLDWHETQSVDAIGINWQFVGSNGKTHWQDEPLSSRFPKALGGANQHIKSMFRTKKFLHSFAHDPMNIRDEHVVFRNSNREIHLFDPANSRGLSINPDINMAAVVHFFYKSNEEFIWKSSRNRGDHARGAGRSLMGLEAGFIASFVEVADAGTTPTMMPAYKTIVAAQMTMILGYSKVSTAIDKVKAHYQSQIGSLIRQAASHPAMAEAGESGARFMAPLTSL